MRVRHAFNISKPLAYGWEFDVNDVDDFQRLS
jgi:hypothetical protein